MFWPSGPGYSSDVAGDGPGRKHSHTGAADRVNQAKRIAKEANNKTVHGAGGSNKKNMKSGPPDTGTGDVAAPDAENPPVVVEVPSFVAVVTTPGCDYMFDGLHFYYKGFDTNGSKPALLVQAGTVCNGLFKQGLVKLKADEPEGIATSCFSFMEWVSYTIDGVTYPGASGWAFEPALRFLRTKLAHTATVTIARKKTATGRLQQEYPTMPMPLLLSTIDTWWRVEVVVQHAVLNTHTARVIGGEETCVKYDEIAIDQSRLVSLDTQHDGFYKLEGIQCDIEPQWDYKRIYKLTCKGAVDVNRDPVEPHLFAGMRLHGPDALFEDMVVHGAEGDPADEGVGVWNEVPDVQYPRFDTDIGPGELSKYPKTVMARFSGSVAPFVNYDVSGVNACKAMKRLLAAREREEVYMSKQAGMLRMLCRDDLINQEVLDTLKVRIDGNVMTVGEGELSHKIICDKVDRPRVRAAYRKLFRRCRRSTLERAVDSMKDCAHWAYYAGYCAVIDFIEEQTGREMNADIPHIRRELRRAYVKGVQLHDTVDIMVTRLNATVKKEWAKYGKVPRLYVSYEAGCMFANELPEYLKLCLDKEFYFPRGALCTAASVRIFIMSKPREDSMSRLFQELIEATITPNTVVCVMYSDDSVFSGNIRGKQFGFNGDIASNDSSNTSLAFAVTGTLLSNFNVDRACGLIKQCMLPVKVVNPNNAEEWYKIQFHSAFEGSGTVLTTILNHCASFGIAVCFCDILTEVIDSGGSFAHAYELGAEAMGHEVTIDNWCIDHPVYEKIQFLKYSPMRTTTGEWVPVLNSGCIFRSLFTTDGDVTALMLGISESEFKVLPWVDRMERLGGSVVRGLVNEPHYMVLDALRDRLGTRGTNISALRFEHDLLSESRVDSDFVGQERLVFGESRRDAVICEESFCRRYDLLLHDLQVLKTAVETITLGRDSVTDAVTAFYRCDYGVK